MDERLKIRVTTNMDHGTIESDNNKKGPYNMDLDEESGKLCVLMLKCYG